jgi:hypothetical protein
MDVYKSRQKGRKDLSGLFVIPGSVRYPLEETEMRRLVALRFDERGQAWRGSTRMGVENFLRPVQHALALETCQFARQLLFDRNVRI